MRLTNKARAVRSPRMGVQGRNHPLLAALAMLGGSGVSAQTQCPVFPCAAWTGPPAITAMTMGDLNGDQAPDFVYSIFNGDVTVVFNDGHGGFDPELTYSLGAAPITLKLNDLDNDQDLDLVGLNESTHAITVIQNAGDGTFLPVQSSPCGLRPRTAALGDIDLDGDMDIVVGNTNSSPLVTILRNGGNGQFAQVASIALPQHATGLTLAKLDNDQWPDLVIATALGLKGTISVRFNNDGLDFGSPVTVADISARGIQPVDLDLDGDFDLVLGGASTGCRLVNDGFGTLTLTCPPPQFAGDVMEIDTISSDPFPDLVILSQGDSSINQLWHWRALSGATFESPAPLVGPANFLAMKLADVDGDGDNDAMLGSRAGLIHLKNPGDGKLIGHHVLDHDFSGSILSLHDFDGDGDLDVFSTGGGSFRYSRNDGNLVFAPPQTMPFSIPSIRQLLWTDIDGDADKDAILISSNSMLYILRNTAGTLGQLSVFQAGEYGIDAADFDRDGDMDIVATRSWPEGMGTTVRYFANNGLGVFAEPVELPVGIFPTRVAARDLNDDGYPDIVALCIGLNSRGVAVVINQGMHEGSLTFAPSVLTPLDNPQGMSVDDLNGDGHIDVAVQLFNKLAVLTGNGNGAFEDPHYYDAPFTSGDPILADVDGDGRSDITVRAASNSVLHVLRNQGDGIFITQPHLLLTQTGSGTTAIGDITGDGEPDVLTTHGSRLAILIHQPRFATVLQPPEDMTVAVGDTATMVIVAEADEPISYQWYRGTEALNDTATITGSQTDRLEITAVTAADSGDYRVRLTGSACSMHSRAGKLRALPACLADLMPPNGDWLVNVIDLLAVINAWGACPIPNDCPTDIAPNGPRLGDGVVNVQDLLTVINHWGACPR